MEGYDVGGRREECLIIDTAATIRSTKVALTLCGDVLNNL